MAEKSKVVLINQRLGKLVLKDKSLVLPGGSFEVDADEARALLNHKGVVDASKAVPAQGSQLDKLREEVAALKKRNAELEADADPKKGKK